MPRRRPYTDDELRAAVAMSSRLVHICRSLDIAPGGKTYRALRREIVRLKIDAAHVVGLEPGTVTRFVRADRRWTEAQLTKAVADSNTISGVCRALGYETSGGIHRYIAAAIRARNLDTSHFVGQAWAKGRRVGSVTRRPLSEILVEGSDFGTSRLRQRLIAEGLKLPLCEGCGLTEWLGERLPLQLDHINGDPRDNRIENLRILCPNCHALTPTWCVSKRRRTPIGQRGVA